MSTLRFLKKAALFPMEVSGDRILAFASIDVNDHTHIKQAIQFFGGVYLGFQVQEGADDR